VNWPYHFPHSADEIAREAERFRRLPPAERWRKIIEMVALAQRQLEASPNRAAIEAQIEADERAWQDAHRRVFERFGF
jgi:hypothetical protein